MEDYLIAKIIGTIIGIWFVTKHVRVYIKQKRLDEEIARRKEYNKRPDYKDF